MALVGAVTYGRQFVKALLNGLLEVNDVCAMKARSVSSKCALQLTAVSSGRGLHVVHASQLQRRLLFGDDAYFIARHKLADVLGVADGVGGWRSHGVDPSMFSSSLMKNCSQVVQRDAFQPHRPAGILATSYYDILDSKQSIVGSCTACIVSFNKADSTLYAANLGDSGFIVVRGNRIVHRSREQQHYFNAPFQLAVVPPSERDQCFSDLPETAEQSSISLQEGDVILVGTDGLFDNVDDATLLGFLPALVEDDSADSIQRVADAIVRRAIELSEDPHYISPFARNAIANGIFLRGGKPDDITLLLAKVTRSSVETGSDTVADKISNKRRAQSVGSVNDTASEASSSNTVGETRFFIRDNFAKRTGSVTGNRELGVLSLQRDALLLAPSEHAARSIVSSSLRVWASSPSLLTLNSSTNDADSSSTAFSSLSACDSSMHVFSLPLD